MKKALSAIIALFILVTCLAGCRSKSDKAYIQEKGALVVGITPTVPLDYPDESGNWIGFDADMARAFAEKLGVEAEFRLIQWDEKEAELKNKTIDVVWNGLSLTDDVKAAMDHSNAYCNNQQVVIVKADRANTYSTVDSVKGLTFAVEKGSAGKKQVELLGASFTEMADQVTALEAVAAGTYDAAVIDSLMANAVVGEGTAYANLTYTVGLNDDQYVVGVRKGSDLVTELNSFFRMSYADGTLLSTAERYGTQAAIIPQS